MCSEHVSPVAFYSVSYDRTMWALRGSFDEFKDRNGHVFEAFVVGEGEMSSYGFVLV